MEEKKHISFETENLAFPEVRTGPEKDEEEETPEKKGKSPLGVEFSDLAVPEVVAEKEEKSDK